MKNATIVIALLLLGFPKQTALESRTKVGKPVAQRMITAVYGTRDLRYPCRLLRNAPQQRKTCLRDTEIQKLFQKAAQVAKVHCQEQFRFYPWECSSAHGNINFVKRSRMYRETAVLYAMYSAALVHTVSQACAQGSLGRCSCSEQLGQTPRSTWYWGVCGDDLNYGRRFARRFLQLLEEGMDPLGNLVRHNSEVGIQSVEDNTDNQCKCHGISGSCTMRTCWIRMRDFKHAAQQLKYFYNSAMLHAPSNNIRPQKMTLTSKQQLLYLENSPSFCSGTRGRQCENPPNCATLCCGRGYVSRKVPLQVHCNCYWQSGFDLKCSVCNKSQEIFVCK